MSLYIHEDNLTFKLKAEIQLHTSDMERLPRQSSGVRQPQCSLAACVKHSVLSSKSEHGVRARGELVGRG